MNNVEIPAKYAALFDHAIRTWIPGGRVFVQKDLVGGRSAAAVVVVDLSPAPTASSDLISGEYILKLDERVIWSDHPEPSESERHEAARAVSLQFAGNHIPRLVRSLEIDQKIALLYEIAGAGLSRVVTADRLDAGALGEQGTRLASDLLHIWNVGYTTDNMSTGELLYEWLGYRLDQEKAPRLHKFIADRTGGEPILIEAGRVLVNPLWLCMYEEVTTEARHTRFIGTIHGDLHPGNVLPERNTPTCEKYWLIDFALSRPAPLLYDHAYFELAVLLRNLDGLASERMLGVLDALDSAPDSSDAFRVPTQDLGIVHCIQRMRLSTESWQRDRELNRPDPFAAQLLLARIAVSLNWINKPIEPAARILALAYGAWSAKKFLKLFHEAVYHQLMSHRVLNTTVQPSAPQSSESQWSEIWERLGRFDSTRWKYVLVSARVPTQPNLASLGLLPWSAIVDMDPGSDVDGLQKMVAPVLEQIRSVSRFGREFLPVDYQRGTAWLMAVGWPSRHEPVPESLKEWRRQVVPRIREMMLAFRRAAAPQKIKVLVFSGDGLSEDTLHRILETVDECLGDQGELIILGPAASTVDESLTAARYTLTSDDFIRGVHQMYGANGHSTEPRIPSANGQAKIPIARLRNLQEDLDILHSEILSEEVHVTGMDDAFWRGAPPTWSALHSGADIVRSIHTDVMRSLEDALGESRNRTIELHHSPGAGGTTVALRAAWDLHRKYPVAILRRTSRMTLDRIDQFFQLCQRSVLIVAEASVLAPSSREDLYRELVNRNSRAVILYVVRTTNTDEGRPLRVIEPMSTDEAQVFYQHYSTKADSIQRQQSLKRITTSRDPQWQRYRMPFFYGLFTYEREFQSIERFVTFHLNGIGYRPRKALLYLALVTRYSQAWIDESMLFSILGLPGDSNLNFENVVGRDPASLIVRHQRQRKLLHPLIAEQTLRELLGGHEGDSWKAGLKDLAIDFIQDVVRILGPDAVETSHLLVQLFIQRDVWYEQQAKGRPRFAELISEIQSIAGQHQVLAELTKLCPGGAHYWNHLGRHHFYELKSDFAQAEKCLEKAIELSPEDSYHHHSLGMVRRIWVEDLLKDASKTPQRPDELLLKIEDLVERAADNFLKSRDLNPVDEHGYITHTQMILHVSERLLRASGAPNLARINWHHGRVASWLKANIVVAEDLMAQLKHLRGQTQPSRYELDCTSTLTGLYGNFNSVIGSWERMLAGRVGSEDLRRTLASAYYSRGRRIWSRLPDVDLRRVVELMEENLRGDPANTRDVRMWFQAYRRLPEFSQLVALDRLETWAIGADALDAHFYLYILHYLRFRAGNSQSEAKVLQNLDYCRQGAQGKRGHSYEWLGTRPDWCPLVHHSELGEWNRKIDFYPDPSPLVRVTGSIETIKGPKSGTIRIGPSLRAFFVPGTRQWESKDVNAIVQFYLGFSYDGPRAWSVELATDGGSPVSAHLHQSLGRAIE